MSWFPRRHPCLCLASLWPDWRRRADAGGVNGDARSKGVSPAGDLRPPREPRCTQARATARERATTTRSAPGHPRHAGLGPPRARAM